MTELSASDLRQAAISCTSYRAVSPDVHASGLRTHQLRFENLSANGLPRPAEEFLVGGRLRRWDRESALSASAYFADPTVAALAELDTEVLRDDEIVQLPPNIRTRLELGEAVSRRRSTRTYSGDPVGLPELATLLRHVGAITAEGDVDLMRGGTVTYRFRTVPSAGGLYPVELWVAALNITGLSPAVYRYAPRLDGLVQVGDAGVLARLSGCFAIPDDQITISSAAAVLCYVARPWRTMRKYGPRGMRFVLHEIGGMSQNAHLTVAALGLGSVDCAGFYDDEVNEVLGLDGVLTAVLHTSVLGWQG
ncbi:SagB/ThcOx family dehydrogenase [Crossiella cryophila]|uniref:SagB-type dehydrogenase family enzyme n=1 Tax=Crossiella cryophila TaxID=43355 RepID=A0A7W7CGD6_9PSEU|nr:SagB/ThcOx family dehydrogenase [Crossiella cryophila]MBB4680447.1 SagB-type dehydrogenase family enzyme [Crossiella cryophila]